MSNWARLIFFLLLEHSCDSRQLCGGNQAATERMIQFGRELQTLSEQLSRQYGKNAMHKKMLQVQSERPYERMMNKNKPACLKLSAHYINFKMSPLHIGT